MMTEKLYDADSSCRHFTATVLSCEKAENGYAIVLDRTAFFPESGGQGSDTGKIGEAIISHVSISDGTISHFSDRPLNSGDTVMCDLDWEQRFLRMQNHTGEHIISGVIHTLFGYDNVGFHLGEHGMTADFNGELTKSDLTRIESEANRIVFENCEVVTWYPAKDEAAALDYRSKSEIEGPLRLVKIGTYDLCACCAPHVGKTGEIGLIKILHAERYKSGMRLWIACGGSALADYREKQDKISSIMAMMSSTQSETDRAVSALIEENRALNRELQTERQNALLRSVADQPHQTEPILYGTDETDPESLRILADALADRSDCFALVYSAANGSCRLAAVSRAEDLTDLCNHLRRSLSARCGGKSNCFFGTVPVTADELCRAIREYRKLP